MAKQLDTALGIFQEMSKITQTQIEWSAKIDIAQMKSETDKAKAVLKTLGDSFGSVSDSATSMFSNLAEAYGNINISAFDKLTLKDMTQEQINMQKKLLEAQIDYINHLKDQGMDLNITNEGAPDWLNGLMGELFNTILTKAQGEGIKALVGV